MRRVLLAGSGLIAVCAVFLLSGASGSRTNTGNPEASATSEAISVAAPQTNTLMGDPSPAPLVAPRSPVIEASAPINQRSSRTTVPPLFHVNATTNPPVLFADIKPRQVTIDFDVPQLITYKKRAKTVLFQPNDLTHRELLATIATHGIPEYPGDKVHHYLNGQASKQGKVYEWVPLRSQDVERWRKSLGGVWAHRNIGANDFGGSVRAAHYTKLVPEEVLERVETIERYVPDATFYVSDIEKFKDPFLAVGVGEYPMVIIAVWDEPGFTCPPLARVPELVVRK